MKKLLFLFSLLLFFSCERMEMNISNDLKSRVLLISSYDPVVTSFVSDSIVEYYENKKIVEREYYWRQNLDDDFIGVFRTYEYNESNLLSKIRFFNDKDFLDEYATLEYRYDTQGAIQKIAYDKFAASIVSDNLSRTSNNFEYEADTIKRISVDHLDNDAITGTKNYIVYGDMDSIFLLDRFTYVFNDQKDLILVNCTGMECDDTDTKSFREYGDPREPLIDNILGSKLNLFIVGDPIRYFNFEISDYFQTQSYFIYPNIQRNGESRVYNYIFDENDRLIEMRTTGSYAANDVIYYYYE